MRGRAEPAVVEFYSGQEEGGLSVGDLPCRDLIPWKRHGASMALGGGGGRHPGHLERSALREETDETRASLMMRLVLLPKLWNGDVTAKV